MSTQDIKEFNFDTDKRVCKVGSARAESVMKMFGVDQQGLDAHNKQANVKFSVPAGGICYITGPTAQGKSSILKKIFYRCSKDESIFASNIGVSGTDCVLDSIGDEIGEAMRFLSSVGISDAFTLLEPVCNLSDGQVDLFRIAKALEAKKKVMFIDDFCSTLDRLTAAVVACKVSKYARKNGITLFIASSHDDIMSDMRPDVILIVRRNKVEVINKERG